MYSKCQKCGRKLTDPDSMKRGYGPECWEHLTGIAVNPLTDKDSLVDDNLPGQLSILDFPEYMPKKERKG